MAENNFVLIGGAQDTGNPVLDSLVNIACATASAGEHRINFPELHKTLLELAAKEPGGLKARSVDGRLQQQGKSEVAD